ncbi:hypothetical protein C0J52_23933 [Blattella germanica]|nr:hypothetical protein C0J52_23933 [Blattella germanica]
MEELKLRPATRIHQDSGLWVPSQNLWTGGIPCSNGPVHLHPLWSRLPTITPTGMSLNYYASGENY